MLGAKSKKIGLVLSLALVLMVSCSKEVDKMQGGSMVAKTSPSILGSSGESDAVGISSVDGTEMLKGLIDTERRERIEADNLLGRRIDELAASLDDFIAETASAIKRLDETDVANADKSKADLENAVRVLVAADDGNSVKIELLKTDLEQFKNYIAATYATKAELQDLRAYALGIKEITNVLGKKIDDNDVALRRLVDEAILKEHADMLEKIADVNVAIDGINVTVEDMKQDMANCIEDYNKKISDLNASFNATIADVKSSLQDSIQKGDEKVLIKLQEQALIFEKTSQDLKAALNSRIDDLSAQIAQSFGQSKLDLEIAKADLQSKLDIAIENDQKKHDEIVAAIAKLEVELQRVAKIAEDTQALAKANAEAIKILRADFEAEKIAVATKFQVNKEEFDAKLNTLETNLRSEFTDKIKEVADAAATMVQNLGEDVQKQFSKVATDMAELERKQAATSSALNQLFTELTNDKTRQQQFERDVVQPRQDSVAALADFIKTLSEAEIAFIAAISPDQKAPEFYNETFKPIMANCGGNAAASFANAMGLDSFQFLAMEYARNLVFGIRGTSADPIFFGYDTMIKADNLRRLVILAAMRYTVSSESEKCVSDVELWAKDVLFSSAAKSVALRAKIAGNLDLSRSIAKLSNLVVKLADPLKRLEDVIIANADGQMQVDAVLRQNNPDRPALLPRYAITILEAAQNQMFIVERQTTYNRIVGVQQQFAKEDANLAKLVETNRANIESLLSQFKSQTNARLDKIESDVGKLTDSMRAALSVMATLSARAGYGDLVAQIAGIAQPWGWSSPVTALVPKITEVQHYFDAPALANNTSACTGAEVLPGTGGIHTYYQHGGWNACWVNFRGIASSNWVGTANTIKFRVFGSAHKFRVTAVGYDQTIDFRTGYQTIGTNLYGGFNLGVFDMKTPNVLTTYIQTSSSWDGTVVSFEPQAVNSANGAVTKGSAVGYRVQLYSPIVLDFVNVGTLKTMSSMESNVRFDLDNDGNKEGTGWVAGDEGGFLALDMNGNGMIDNGSEFFGQATKMHDGSLAKNGYEALKQYDLNRDGVVDAKDAVFSKLLVWFDANRDGVMQPGETKNMADAGVNKIGLRFEQVSKEKQIDHGNMLKYTAKFWGPKQCGENGCNSYDVFFSTNATVAAK